MDISNAPEIFFIRANNFKVNHFLWWIACFFPFRLWLLVRYGRPFRPNFNSWCFRPENWSSCTVNLLFSSHMGQNVHISNKKKLNLLLLAELNLVEFGCGFSDWFLVAVSDWFLARIFDSSIVTCDRNLMPWEWFLVVTLSALLQMFSADCCQIKIH